MKITVNFLRQEYSFVDDDSFQSWLNVADWLSSFWSNSQGTVLVGLSGAQGSGKSTLAEFLQRQLSGYYGTHCLSLSLDDFYLKSSERLQLAESVHPLLETRGVPGTHDLQLLNEVLDNLLTALSDQQIAIPVFDKLTDNRVQQTEWRNWQGRPDLILLEGWCVGAIADGESDLVLPMNALENSQDQLGIWRRWVNQQLASHYQQLFKRMDATIFIQVPDFEKVAIWRTQQETEMANARGIKGKTAQQIRAFVMHYERITRTMLRDLPARADLLLKLDNRHSILSVSERRQAKFGK